jgi:hypothetical protein
VTATDGALALQHLKRCGWGVRLDADTPKLQRLRSTAKMTDRLRDFAREHREAIILELKGEKPTAPDQESINEPDRAILGESIRAIERAKPEQSIKLSDRATNSESITVEDRVTISEGITCRERARQLWIPLKIAMEKWDATPSMGRHPDDFERIMRAFEQLMCDPEMRVDKFYAVLDDVINDLTTRWLHDAGFERMDADHLIREHIFLAPLPAGAKEVYCEILWPGGEGAPAVASQRN